MRKTLLSRVASKIRLAIFFIAALCVGLAALGCNNDPYRYVWEGRRFYLRIAREQFGLEKILWQEAATYCNPITLKALEDSAGNKIYRDLTLPMEGGAYVVGIDKNDDEVLVVVPSEECKNDSRYRPAIFDWPFVYKFSEIAAFAGEYGYKFADGIDGREDEYFKESTSSCLYAYDRNVKYYLETLSKDVEELYERLDVKLVFTFRHCPDEEHWNDYYIMQEGGELKMYEIKDGDSANMRIITYERRE